MAVLSREALEASPLADLHLIASEVGLEGFRRLRKADLVDAILEKVPGGADAGSDAGDDDAEEAPKRRTRARGGRSRRSARDADSDADADSDDDAVAADEPEDKADADDADEAPARPSSRSRGGRSRGSARNGDREEREPRGRSEAREPLEDREPRGRRQARDTREPAEDREPRGRRQARDTREPAEDREPRSRREPREPREPREAVEERIVEGTIEVLGNGSGFLRVSPPEPSDDDVYVSAAQIRRCELTAGDVVAGPVRAPRRSERYPSLVRVDSINGGSADEVSEGTPFDSLPAAFPTERFELGSDDATLKAIEWLTPLGRGSRAVVAGAARSGKTEALRRLAVALGGVEGLEVSVVLAGVRAEEVSDWTGAGVEPVTTLTLGASADTQTSAVERAVDSAKRVAARGGHAVVIIDGLDGVHPPAARRALAAARNIVDGGSLTVIAGASAPLGGETTVVALDVALTSTDRLPALDLVTSGTLRPELLVGEAGATAIAQARAEALG